MLHFEIDLAQVDRVAAEMVATPRQVVYAFSRALGRTAATLRRMSERGLRDELRLRTIQYLRLRLRTIKLRANADGAGFRLWYGLNPMPVGEFKGRPATTERGASFRGHEFVGGFKGRNKRGRPTVFKRKGGARLPIVEQTLDIKDQMDVYVEDRIFTEAETIFWRHFERDLAARTKFGVGK